MTVRDHWEDQALTIWNFIGRVTSLLFNILSRFIITFLPRSKHLLISCLQSPSAVILEPKKRKSSTFPPSICHEVLVLDAMILVFFFFFLIFSFKQLFHSLPSPSSRGSLVPLCLLPLESYYLQRVGHDWAIDLIWPDLQSDIVDVSSTYLDSSL